jgi:uncharacterized protein with GYD domain
LSTPLDGAGAGDVHGHVAHAFRHEILLKGPSCTWAFTVRARRSREVVVADACPRGREAAVPIYVTLFKWTDQGRKDVGTLPDRAAAVAKRIEQVGGKVIGNYVTMGQYDQIAITEAPDDETVAKMALIIAGRGNAVSETLRGFTMDEVRKLV